MPITFPGRRDADETAEYGAAMAATAVASHFWQKYYPENHDMYAFALAAGMCAGEGIGGCFNALLTICPSSPLRDGVPADQGAQARSTGPCTEARLGAPGTMMPLHVRRRS